MEMNFPMRFGVFLLLGLGLGGCSALGGDWPNLAGDPPAEPVALLDPVEQPAPSPLYAPMTLEDAHALLETLPALVADLDRRISEQQALYEKARNARGTDADIKMAGTSQRTAEFQLSRLSLLETETSRLLRRAESMTAALRGTPDEQQAAALTNALSRKAELLTGFLSDERSRLAASSPS